MKTDARAGFTLIELLVSLSILSILMVAIGGGLRLAADAWRRSEATLTKVLSDAQGVRIAASVLRGAAPVAKDEEASWISGDRASVEFVTVNPPRAARQGAMRARLELQSSDGGTRLFLKLAPYDPFAEGAPVAWPEASELMRVEGALSFFYFSAADGGVWTEEWSAPFAPKAIKVAHTDDPENTLFIASPRAFSVACLERSGDFSPPKRSEACR